TNASGSAAKDGLIVGSLEQILSSQTREQAAVEQHLARNADYAGHGFVALNTAFVEDGAVVIIPDGYVAERPIYLLFISAADGRPVVSYPRTLVVAGRDCQVRIIEAYMGAGEDTCFTNAVTEIVAGENAIVDHYKVQQESDRAFHIATVQVRQDRSSNFY